MKLSETLKKTCKELHVSMSELARSSGQTPQNLSMKLKRDTLSYREFCDFMSLMGVKINLEIIYPDGQHPEMPAQDPRTADMIGLMQEELQLFHRKQEYHRQLNRDIRMILNGLQNSLNAASAETKHENANIEKAVNACARVMAVAESAIDAADIDPCAEEE